MKTKIVLLLFLFGASVSSLFAQENGGRSAKSMEFNKRLQQGHYTVATNFTYGWGTRTNEWLGTAQLGYFLTDHWVGGVQLGLGGSKVDLTPIFAVDPNYDLKSGTTASYIPELYTRYYFLNSRFRPFVQVSAGYTRTNTKEYNGSNEINTRNFGRFTYGAAVGVSYQVGKRVGIEALYNMQFYNKTETLKKYREPKLKLGVSVFF